MARILVEAEDSRRTVLLDERNVRPQHINDQHSAVQLLERLEWAIQDAERRVQARRHGRRRRREGERPRMTSASTAGPFD